MQRDMAMAQQQEALAREKEARAMAEETVETARLTEATTDQATLGTIKIDDEGNVRLNDEQLALTDLRASLRAVWSEGSSNVQLLIQVDERCAAAYIIDVVHICDEVGIENVRLTSLDESAEAAK